MKIWKGNESRIKPIWKCVYLLFKNLYFNIQW